MNCEDRFSIASKGRTPLLQPSANFVPEWKPEVNHEGFLPIIDGKELSIPEHGLFFAKTELITHLWNMVWGDDGYTTDDDEQIYQDAVINGTYADELRLSLSRAIFTRVTMLETIEYSAADFKNLNLEEELRIGF